MTIIFIPLHPQEQHPVQFTDYERQKNSKRRKKKGDVDGAQRSADSNQGPHGSKQASLCQIVENACDKKITQEAFDKAVTELIVTDMMPTATVERTGFENFCRTVAPRLSIPSRRTVVRRITAMFYEKKTEIIEEISNALWVSSTADLWSSHHRAYMGVTVHYVDAASLERKGFVIACRRFKYEHTAERIAEMLIDIYNEFSIMEKVKDCVTDNAANFAKAFRMFSRDSATSEATVEESDEDEEDITDMSESVECEEIFGLLNSVTDDDAGLTSLLPPQKRCANHLLNLVASVDAPKARSNPAYKSAHDRAMGKVQALSNAVHRSTKMSDIVHRVTGTTFISPTSTRWSSDFEAVKRVLDIGIDKVKQCSSEMKLKGDSMTESDFCFLEAYVKVMAPVAAAMKLLQGEKDCFLGHVIPMVLGIKTKLSAICKVKYKIVVPLINVLQVSLDERFRDILQSDEYKIATVLVPRFKMSCISQSGELTTKEKVIAAIEEVLRKSEQMNDNKGMDLGLDTVSQSSTLDSQDDDNLFSFVDNTCMQDMRVGSTTHDKIVSEFESYLLDKRTDTKILHTYPCLKACFVKFNASLPSSAVVERLFSLAGQILTPRRCRISDTLFEKMVVLRSLASSAKNLIQA